MWNIENTNTSKELALRDNFTMEWTVFDALRTRARLGFSKSITKSEAFKSPNHVDFLETEKLKKGSFSSSQNESFSYNGDLNITFGKIFKNVHQVNFVGGWSFNESRTEAAGYNVVGFNDDFHKNPAYSTGFRRTETYLFEEPQAFNQFFHELELRVQQSLLGGFQPACRRDIRFR
ncbi:MAG: hypothetical protein ACLTZT_11300 [Butyricimonas faecalis]